MKKTVSLVVIAALSFNHAFLFAQEPIQIEIEIDSLPVEVQLPSAPPEKPPVVVEEPVLAPVPEPPVIAEPPKPVEPVVAKTVKKEPEPANFGAIGLGALLAVILAAAGAGGGGGGGGSPPTH